MCIAMQTMTANMLLSFFLIVCVLRRIDRSGWAEPGVGSGRLRADFGQE